ELHVTRVETDVAPSPYGLSPEGAWSQHAKASPSYVVDPSSGWPNRSLRRARSVGESRGRGAGPATDLPVARAIALTGIVDAKPMTPVTHHRLAILGFCFGAEDLGSLLLADHSCTPFTSEARSSLRPAAQHPVPVQRRQPISLQQPHRVAGLGDSEAQLRRVFPRVVGFGEEDLPAPDRDRAGPVAAVLRRSGASAEDRAHVLGHDRGLIPDRRSGLSVRGARIVSECEDLGEVRVLQGEPVDLHPATRLARVGEPALPDRKSTRLNSSHVSISYAVFCLKKKKNTTTHSSQRR